MNKNYEKDLPQGYRQVYSLDAKKFSTALWMNLVGAVVAIALLVLAFVGFFLVLYYREGLESTSFDRFPLFFLLPAILIYILLHELVHGAVYHHMTKEKLTFGITLTVAYCGVPNIYTYRKTTLCAVLAPFVLFTLILLPLTVILLFSHLSWYLVCAAVLIMHLTGCVGDLYVTFLLLFRYRDPRLLVRDTGPAQFFYLPEE